MRVLATSFLNFAELLDYDGVTFFDTTDFPEFPLAPSDTYISVDQTYLGRLDLVAYDYWGDVNLWWVIALVNNLEKVPTQMFLGQKLRVPDISEVRKFLSKGNGG